MPGSQRLLPAPSPLRTVGASFQAYGSSLDKAPSGTQQHLYAVPISCLYCLHDTSLNSIDNSICFLPVDGIPSFTIAPEVVNGFVAIIHPAPLGFKSFSELSRDSRPVGSQHPFGLGITLFPTLHRDIRFLRPPIPTYLSAPITGRFPLPCGGNWGFNVPLI